MLKSKEGELVTLNFLFSYDISHPRKLLARLKSVGMDFFSVETFEKGQRQELIFPFPTIGLFSISFCSDSEESLEFERQALEHLAKQDVQAKYKDL